MSYVNYISVKLVTWLSGKKKFACQCRRLLGEGNGHLLQYSCLGNPMDREEPGGLQSMGLQKSWTQETK